MNNSERTTAPSGAVIVTGGSRGLGRGIALELAAAGWSVAINYRGNQEAARATLEDCQTAATDHGHHDARFVTIQGDISRKADREALVEETVREFGSIAGLVNNAGIAPAVRADITEATEESFQELMTTNLQGPYFLTQAVARHWLANPGEQKGTAAPQRHIVFVTSISATAATITRGEYCVSKAGLAMAAQLWATRLAGEGINVYEVRPGIMETDMTSGVKEKYDALIAEGLVPQRRWGAPQDIGRIIRAIMAGDLGFSPGAVIHADGGIHMERL